MKHKALIAPVLLCIIGFAGYKMLAPPKPPTQAVATGPTPAVSVRVARARKHDLPLLIASTGRTEAMASVAIKSRVDGTVSAMQFEEGKAVRKGQPLVRLDPATLEAQLRQARSVLARDQALLVRVRNDLERNRSLAGQGFISTAALAQSVADADAAQAGVSADQAGLDNAVLQLGYTQILAPTDGLAGVLQIPVGGTVQANASTLLVINQVQPLYVAFSLAEAHLAQLKQAMRRGSVVVQASVADVAQPLVGRMAFLDNAVDAASGSILGKAVFDNADHMLTPGQFAEVAIQVDTLHAALCVPSAAIEDGLDGPYVFVVGAGARAEIRKIKTGADSGGFTQVTQGLNEDEIVVVDQQAKLRNASTVRIENPP